MRKIKIDRSLLHSVTRSTLFLCYRTIGLFPITELYHSSADKLRLNNKSWYSVAIAVAVLVNFFVFCGSLYSMATTSLNIRTSVEFISNILSFSRIMLLLRFSNVWPSVIQTSMAIESNLRGLQIDKPRVLKKCRIVLAFFVTYAIVKLILFTAYLYKAAEVSNDERMPGFEAFMRLLLPGVFQMTPYHLWKGILFFLSLCQGSILQDTLEVIIMQVSIYLTCLFKAYNKRAKNSVKLQTQKCLAWMMDKTEMKHVEWRTLRLEYMNICKLVDLVNKNVNGIILVVYAQNILLVWYELLQLMRVWTPYNYIRTCYHYISLAFMVIRIWTTSWLAADIEAVSKRSELYIYEVTEVAKTNIEAERLLCQIRSSTITLDGLGFFRITKSMILSVIGTIATYEIMALQYTPSDI